MRGDRRRANPHTSVRQNLLTPRGTHVPHDFTNLGTNEARVQINAAPALVTFLLGWAHTTHEIQTARAAVSFHDTAVLPADARIAQPSSRRAKIQTSGEEAP